MNMQARQEAVGLLASYLQLGQQGRQVSAVGALGALQLGHSLLQGVGVALQAGGGRRKQGAHVCIHIRAPRQ